MRLLLAVAFALAFAFVGAGCLGAPNVRAVLVHETITLGDGAPSSAREQLASAKACPPGTFDPVNRTLALAPHELAPTFALIRDWGEGYAVLTARGDGPFGTELLAGFGTSGSWGWGGPFRDSPDLARLTYDRIGAKFNGVPLEKVEPLRLVERYNATMENVTFEVEHAIEVTYLGRLPYDESHACDAT